MLEVVRESHPNFMENREIQAEMVQIPCKIDQKTVPRNTANRSKTAFLRIDWPLGPRKMASGMGLWKSMKKWCENHVKIIKKRCQKWSENRLNSKRFWKSWNSPNALFYNTFSCFFKWKRFGNRCKNHEKSMLKRSLKHIDKSMPKWLPKSL